MPVSGETSVPVDGISIRKAAVAVMARRDHSCYELKQKLTAKFGDARLVEQQLDRLIAEQLQSDERFVAAFVRNKQNRGKGAHYIRQALQTKGIDRDLAERYLNAVENDWPALAVQVYRKKYGNTVVTGPQERAKRMRFMASRGFSEREIYMLFDN